MALTPRDELIFMIAEEYGKRRNGPASDGRGWFRDEEDQAECTSVAEMVVAMFGSVRPETRDVETTGLGDARRSYIRSRLLIAEIFTGSWSVEGELLGRSAGDADG